MTSTPHYAGVRGPRHNRELALLGRLLDAGRNPVRGDLLSYLSRPELIGPLVELDGGEAQAWLDDRVVGTRGAREPLPVTPTISGHSYPNPGLVR